MSVGFSHIGSRKQSYAKCFSSLAPSIKPPSAHQRKRWVGVCGTCTKSCDSCVAWLGGVAPVQSLVTLVLLGSQKKLYAIVEFVYRESALRVLQHPDTLHLHGKKLVVKPREVKPLRRDERAKEEEGSGVVKETSPPLGSSPLPCFVGGVRVPQEAVAELQQATSVSCLDAI